MKEIVLISRRKTPLLVDLLNDLKPKLKNKTMTSEDTSIAKAVLNGLLFLPGDVSQQSFDPPKKYKEQLDEISSMMNEIDKSWSPLSVKAVVGQLMSHVEFSHGYHFIDEDNHVLLPDYLKMRFKDLSANTVEVITSVFLKNFPDRLFSLFQLLTGHKAAFGFISNHYLHRFIQNTLYDDSFQNHERKMERTYLQLKSWTLDRSELRNIQVNQAARLTMNDSNKITPHRLFQMKAIGEPITMLTAYNREDALRLEEANVDITLVGDSYGTVRLGYDSTSKVSMSEMLEATRAVKQENRTSMLVGDLPHVAYKDDQPDGSYRLNISNAVENAKQFLDAGADAIKLEGGEEVASAIKAIRKLTDIPVMAHIGHLPQTDPSPRIQGRNVEEVSQLMKDALAVERAGAFAVVIEQVDMNVAELISRHLAIPVIGIGAGPFTDGQVLVIDDLLGVTDFENKNVFPNGKPSLIGQWPEKFENETKENYFARILNRYVYLTKNGLFPDVNSLKDGIRVSRDVYPGQERLEEIWQKIAMNFYLTELEPSFLAIRRYLEQFSDYEYEAPIEFLSNSLTVLKAVTGLFINDEGMRADSKRFSLDAILNLQNTLREIPIHDEGMEKLESWATYIVLQQENQTKANLLSESGLASLVVSGYLNEDFLLKLDAFREAFDYASPRLQSLVESIQPNERAELREYSQKEKWKKRIKRVFLHASAYIIAFFSFSTPHLYSDIKAVVDLYFDDPKMFRYLMNPPPGTSAFTWEIAKLVNKHDPELYRYMLGK